MKRRSGREEWAMLLLVFITMIAVMYEAVDFMIRSLFKMAAWPFRSVPRARHTRDGIFPTMITI